MFSGEGNGRTAVFETGGPWLLDWAISSDTPLLTVFEMRLHEAESGEYLGTLVELHGIGNGLKLFEQGGAFEIGIVANNASWQLQVIEVSPDTAAEIRRLDAGKPTLQDSTRKVLQRLREGSFKEWRPDGDEALLLFDDNGMGWRATFAQPCPGLTSAAAISFVTPVGGSLEEYDSILLDNGTRCYFERVVPALLD
jgi:hypothetical protein